jgi:hypothetical protein
MACPLCRDVRWVCEEHPTRPDPCDCSGAGMPCPVCNTDEPPALPAGWQSIASTRDEDDAE